MSYSHLIVRLVLGAFISVGFSPPLAAKDTDHGPLRVCSDPNNLPFSNRNGEGLENKLAELLARELGATLETTFWAQRRGFVRNMLAAGRCDVLMSVPKNFEQALTTSPYYRSSYVFASAQTLQPPLQSLDDPRLKTLRIGVPLVGDDGMNPPPAHALARRGVIANVVGFTVFGDYAEPNPPTRLLEAVAHGDLDTAIAWGPVAGYIAKRGHTPLRVLPVRPSRDAGMTFVFDIALGVRRGDFALRDRLERALHKQRRSIVRLLTEYGFPQVGGS